jgi:hypothetical protein
MRVSCTTLAIVASAVALATAPAARAQDADRSVAGGGITVQGWQGQVDAAAAKSGKSVADSKFGMKGEAIEAAIGPAAIYWNPANTASGDFTVKATFHELKTTSDHPHPYGIFIGGSQLGTDDHRLLYCVAYGDGTFLVRGFKGQQVMTVDQRAPNDAVRKHGADGGVTQEIAWKVGGGKAECSINGTTVASFDTAAITGDNGPLSSTDGIVGLRFSHNVDVIVSGFSVSK